jgi:hypothetical protein
MIINKETKMFQTRSDKPYENWTNDDCFVIPDNSEIAQKIIGFYPYYDFVLDEEGNLIDIVQIEPPTNILAEQEKEQLKKQLSDTDYKAIKYAERSII